MVTQPWWILSLVMLNITRCRDQEQDRKVEDREEEEREEYP